MKATRLLTLSLAAVLPACIAGAASKEIPKDIIATQIRKQGFDCNHPESATRDPAASKPDDAAWILKCDGVTYKVLLVPKQAAKVERVADEPKSESKTSP